MIILNNLDNNEFLEIMEILQLNDPCYLGRNKECDNCNDCDNYL